MSLSQRQTRVVHYYCRVITPKISLASSRRDLRRRAADPLERCLHRALRGHLLALGADGLRERRAVSVRVAVHRGGREARLAGVGRRRQRRLRPGADLGRERGAQEQLERVPDQQRDTVDAQLRVVLKDAENQVETVSASAPEIAGGECNNQWGVQKAAARAYVFMSGMPIATVLCVPQNSSATRSARLKRRHLLAPSQKISAIAHR